MSNYGSTYNISQTGELYQIEPGKTLEVEKSNRFIKPGEKIFPNSTVICQKLCSLRMAGIGIV